MSSNISDKHLENLLRIAATSTEPNINAVVAYKKGQISHFFFMFLLLSFSNILIIYIYTHNFLFVYIN